MAEDNQVFLWGAFGVLEHRSKEVAILTIYLNSDSKMIPIEIVCMGKSLKQAEKFKEDEKIWVYGKITQYSYTVLDYRNGNSADVTQTQIRAQNISKNQNVITTAYKKLISVSFASNAPINCCDKCGWEIKNKNTP